jgi:hypothetical protein
MDHAGFVGSGGGVMLNNNMRYRSLGVLPGPQLSGGGGSNAAATVFGLAGTTNGQLVQYTTTALGGLTPKAAIVLVSNATTDGVHEDDSMLSIGFTDGTTDACFATFKENLAAIEQRRSYAGLAVEISGNTDLDGVGVFSQWVTNGIEIEWTTGCNAARIVMVILFAGDDLQAHVTTDQLDTTTQSVVTGFQPDVVFTAMNGGPVPGNGIFTALNFGCCLKTGVSSYTEWMNATGGDLDSNDGASRIESSVGADFDNASVNYSVNLDNFTASGFDHTADSAPGTDGAGFLAISYGGQASYDMDILVYNNSVVGLSVEPAYVIGGLGYSSEDAQNNARCAMGVFTLQSTGAGSVWYHAENNADGSEAVSMADSDEIHMTFHTGADQGVADLTSLDANGFTLNWTDGASALHRAWFLAIEFAA